MRTIALAEGRASSQSSDDQDLLQDMRDSLLSSTSSAGNIPYRWREMEQSLSSGETRKKPQLNLNIWLNLLRERLEYLSSDLKDDISASYGTISPDQPTMQTKPTSSPRWTVTPRPLTKRHGRGTRRLHLCDLCDLCPRQKRHDSTSHLE